MKKKPFFILFLLKEPWVCLKKNNQFGEKIIISINCFSIELLLLLKTLQELPSFLLKSPLVLNLAEIINESFSSIYQNTSINGVIGIL